ncbi:MAG: acyltransferase [Lysobacterales bacterium]
MISPADQGRRYVASLTGLRGIAALAVFIFHYGYFNPGIRLDLTVPVIGNALQFPLGFGFAGVDIFFVLSGFLLSLPFARATLSNMVHPPLGHYYKRRLLRVFPAYYAQLAIIMVTGAWFITWRPLDATGLLAHLLMFFNIGWNPVSPVVGVWWTLPVEFSFYLILPFIASFMRPARWMLFLLGGVLLSTLYRLWCADHFAAAPEGTVFLAASHLPGYLPEFLLGASAALLVQWHELRRFNRPAAWLLDGLFLAGACLSALWFWQVVLPNGDFYWSGHWSMVIAPLALGLPLSMMVISLYWGSRIGKLLFANPPVYFLGLISYSLYLWHFIVLQQAGLVLGEAFTGLQGLTKFLVSLSLVVLVASVSYFLFERPFFRLGAQRKPRDQA